MTTTPPARYLPWPMEVRHRSGSERHHGERTIPRGQLRRSESGYGNDAALQDQHLHRRHHHQGRHAGPRCSGAIANSPKIIVGDAGSSGAVLDVSAKRGFTIASTQKLERHRHRQRGAEPRPSPSKAPTPRKRGHPDGGRKSDRTGPLYGTTSVFQWDINTGTAFDHMTKSPCAGSSHRLGSEIRSS